jgi:Fic family protein
MVQKYIWQQEGWPEMSWQDSSVCNLLADVNMLRGQLLGRLQMFGMNEQNDSFVETLTQEIINSSEIEGERLNRDSVRSSVARQLGLEHDGLPREDHYIEGVVQVMLDATHNYSEALTEERLFGWHAALFPTGYSGAYKISVARWREGDEPMQVVSGAYGNQKVHYEAPPSKDVPRMMSDFINWVNNESKDTDPLVKAAIAHLWFVTIHPFDDGNGRICRTITEMLLSRADKTQKRFYSLSSTILNKRKGYYQVLEASQKGSLDVTPWTEWFLQSLKEALTEALTKTDNIVYKTAFWDKHRNTPLNERQRKVLNMLLDGFEGKLNSSKWYKINHCSQDTAIRDIKDLISKGILRSTEEGGRSTNYELVNSK